MNKQTSLITLLVLFAFMFLGNIAFRELSVRMDITEKKLYTLSDGSKNILKNLEEDVTIKLFFSKDLKDVPPIFKSYYNRVKAMLVEFQSYNSDLITLEFIDPVPYSDEELTAQKYGIQGPPVSREGSFYFGLVITNFNGDDTISYLNVEEEDRLEYELIRRIYSLSQTEKLKIGIISSLDVLGAAPPPQQNPFGGPPQQQGTPPWLFTQELSQNYELEKVDPNNGSISDDIDLLMIIHAKNLELKAQYAIDQYVMSGKNVLIHIDPHSTQDQQPQQRFRPPTPDQSFTNLFDKWGIDFNISQIALDYQLAMVQPNPQGRRQKTPHLLQFSEKQISENNLASAELDNLIFFTPGSVKLKDGVEGVTFESLVQTSDQAIEIDHFRLLSTQITDIIKMFNEPDRPKAARNLAGIFSGSFKSAFDKAPEGVTGTFVAEAKDKGHIAVIADVDMIHDNFWVQMQRTPFGNRAQMLSQNPMLNHNLVEQLIGNDDLISLRSRGRSTRPFEKVRTMRDEANLKHEKKKNELDDELSKVKEELQKLLSQSDPGQKIIINKDLNTEIQKFQKEQLKIQRELRLVEKDLNSSIDALGNRLHLMNLLLIPALIAIYGIFLAVTKSRRVGS